jgi:hypothetical protein
MLRRISTVVAAVAVGSVALVTAPAAAATVGAPKAPTITRVVVQPSPVVIPGDKKVTVTFSFVTGNNATAAEAYLKPPGPSVETKIELTKRNLGFGKTQWTAKSQFDRSAKPGTWNLRVYARNAGGDRSGNKTFEVRQVWKTAFANFDARPRAVTKGDRIRLSGALRVETASGWKALAGEKVHIAFRPLGGHSWKRIDTARTGRDGRFDDRVRATRTGWYRAEYDGSKTTHAAKSGADRVTVKPREAATRISGFSVTPSTVEKGKKVTVKGLLQVKDRRGWDELSGRRVDILFQEKGSREWRRVAADRTDRRGRFTARVTATASGWLRAVFGGGRGLKDASSRPARLTVTPPKADTRIDRFDAYPEPARFGKFLNFRGKLLVRDGHRWVPFARQKVLLYFKADGQRKWSFVEDTRTRGDGSFKLRERAFRSGWWRVVFKGDARTDEAVARPDHVRVVRR